MYKVRFIHSEAGILSILLIFFFTANSYSKWSFSYSSNTGLSISVSEERFYSDQDDFEMANALLQEGIDLGLRYLGSNEKRDKKASKKNLEKAEKILNKLFKKDRECEMCYAKLTEAKFYLAYFQHQKNYKDCIKTAEKGMEYFPEGTSITFYLGYAHYNSGNYEEACKALNYFLILNDNDPEAESQVKQVLSDAQFQFLNGWNEHFDFYKSKDARIDVYNPNSYVPQTLFQVTPQWELNAGNQAYNQLLSQAPQVNDPELQEYLDDLVHKLVSRTPGPFSHYKVTVLESPLINAVTPPGHIIIYTGLIGFVDNEAQLVGVLGHELAHNYAHHSARRFISAYRAQGITNAILQAINPKEELAKTLAQLGGQIGLDLYLKAYSRSKEKEADHYGAHIIYNAGYNPIALSEFFLKLYKHNPKQPPKFLSTHPPLQDRTLYLSDYLESFPMDRETRVDSEVFQRIKKRYTTSNQNQQKDRKARPPNLKNN